MLYYIGMALNIWYLQGKISATLSLLKQDNFVIVRRYIRAFYVRIGQLLLIVVIVIRPRYSLT